MNPLRDLNILELGWKRRGPGHYTRTLGELRDGRKVYATALRSYPDGGGGSWTLIVTVHRREHLRIFVPTLGRAKWRAAVAFHLLERPAAEVA